MSQFTFNSRPAAANYQRGNGNQHPDRHRDRRSADRHPDKYTDRHPDKHTDTQTDKHSDRESDKDRYKYTVIICKNGASVCQYCHIKIKEKDLMLMTRTQRSQNDASGAPIFYGYHCDCFFLSANSCRNTLEIHGYSSLPKYHRQYIARKITVQQNNGSRKTQELPRDLRVGFSLLRVDYTHYCEQCSMAMLISDIKIVGILRKTNDLVVYHPRCFSQNFGKMPVKLAGIEKLNHHDKGVLMNMLNLADISKPLSFEGALVQRGGKSYGFKPSSARVNKEQRDREQREREQSNKERFTWPQPNNHSAKDSSQGGLSSGTSKIWDTLPSTSSNLPSNSSHLPSTTHHKYPEDRKDFYRTETDSNKDTQARWETTDAKKRRPVFKPSLSTHTDRADQRRSVSVSPRKRCISEREETIVDDKRPVRSTEDRRGTSGSDSRKRSTPSSSEADQGSKVELKKSTLRSEITKILYKYNHDYITSKIVRTMLMKKFGADLTPHKKYIDNTIMELLEVIDNDPINLKSIPGRIFVDEGDIDSERPKTSTDPTTADPSSSQLVSPMRADIDDISPFAIMGNQAAEIEQSNVDSTGEQTSSKSAWGDKSNSPKNKEIDTTEEIPGTTTYAISASDKPLNLCECVLCCFRIQSLQELKSLGLHIKTKHGSSKKCIVCDIRFKDCYGLILHVAEFHRTETAFKCRSCGVGHVNHQELARHVDTCYLSDISSEGEGGGGGFSPRTPSKSPSKKKMRIEHRELVTTLKNTQSTLDKINEFITGTGGGFDDATA